MSAQHSGAVDADGLMIDTPTAPAGAAIDPLVERTRATWMAGDFSRIAAGYASGAAEFVNRLSLAQGETVLDVACGTGNLAIPAARTGARVTGVDIAPNLVEQARLVAAGEGLDIRFDVGIAEALPYADGSFDTVISMFGVMFSPRPEAALAELIRVTRPGGRIALANWDPAGFIGAMLRAHTSLVPPPAGVSSVLAWGDEPVMRRRLDVHAPAVASVQFVKRTIEMSYQVSPGGVVELFREFYGPSVRAFAALDAPNRAALYAELLRLWSTRNDAGDASTRIDAEFVEIRITAQ